jgi:hypothetical protein
MFPQSQKLDTRLHISCILDTLPQFQIIEPLSLGRQLVRHQTVGLVHKLQGKQCRRIYRNSPWTVSIT